MMNHVLDPGFLYTLRDGFVGSLRSKQVILDKFVEDDPRTIICFRMLFGPGNSHVFGLDLEKLGFVVSKRRHNVPWSSGCFSAREEGGFVCLVSLLHSFCL